MKARISCWIGAGIAAHLLFLVSLSSGWLDLLFNDSSHTHRSFDFAVLYLAGKAILSGQDAYQLDAAFGFRYLPLFAWIFSRSLALLPFHAAYLVHLGITELFLLADLWITWRWPGIPDSRRGPALFIWLSFSPYYLELYMGQVSFWAASLIFWAWRASGQNAARPAALSWTLSALVKPNSLLLAPVFLRLRQYRTLLFCLAVLLLTSVPYFLTHPGSWSAFARINLSGHHFEGALTHAGNLGLWGSLISLSAKLSSLPLESLSSLSDLPPWAQGTLLLVEASVLAASLAATFLRGSADPTLLFSLWITTYFLVYKDVWEHHYVFLLPALVILYIEQRFSWLPWICLFAALPTPFVLFDVHPGAYGPIDPERTWSLAVSLIYRSSKLVPVLVLWGALLARLWHSPGKETQR